MIHNNEITTQTVIGNIDQQLPTSSSSNSFTATSNIVLPNDPKFEMWLKDEEFIKFLISDKNPKGKQHTELLTIFASFKKAVIKEIDAWILSGALHSDFVQRGSLFQIFEKVNDSLGPNTQLPRVGIEHPFLWSLYNNLGATNALRCNNRDTITSNYTSALKLHPIISQVDRRPLEIVQMDLQSQQIANELANIKDFAATQGRNANDFYNGYTAIASSTTTRCQSVALIYALILSWGYAISCAASIDEDNSGLGDYRLRLSDYEKHSLVSAFSAANNDTRVPQPWFGEVGDTLIVNAQYTTIGWMLAANNNNIDYSSIPNNTPAKRYINGTDSSGVCIIPFKKSLGVIPSIYMIAHLPWPLSGYKMTFEYTDAHGATLDSEFMFNAFNTIIAQGSRHYRHDPIANTITVDVLFVDVTDWNLTMADEYPLPFLNGQINIPSVTQADIDIAAQVEAGFVNTNQDYESSILYALSIYPDTYSFLRGVKTMVSLIVPRTNVAGMQRLDFAEYNDNGANGTFHTTSSISVNQYVHTHFLLDGSPTLVSNISRSAAALRSGFENQAATANIIDSSGIFRCLLASRHLYDIEWSSNYAGLTRFGLSIGTRLQARTTAFGLSAISAILMSMSAILGNGLGLNKGVYAPGIVRAGNPHVGLYQNFVWRGLIDVAAQVAKNEILMGGQIQNGWSSEDWRMTPISTFGKSGLYYCGWQDVSCDSLYTRTVGKNRLPVKTYNNAHYYLLSNASFKFDVTQNIWIGDEWISRIDVGTTSGSGNQTINGRPGDYAPLRYGGLLYSINKNFSTFFEPAISIHSMTNTAGDVNFASEVLTGINSAVQSYYCYLPTVGFSVQSVFNEFVDRDLAILGGQSNQMNIYQPFVRTTAPTFLDQPQMFSSFRMNYGIESVDCNF